MLNSTVNACESVKYTLAGTVNVILIISSQEASLSKQAEAAFNNCITDCHCFSYLVLYIANTYISFILPEKVILNYGSLGCSCIL